MPCLWFLLILLFPALGFTASPAIQVTASLSDSRISLGEHTRLELVFDIPNGYLLYSMTNIEDGPMPISITLNSDCISPTGTWHGSSPGTKWDSGFETDIEYHEHTATYQRNIRGNCTTEDPVIPIFIQLQMCDERNCYSRKLETAVNLQIIEGPIRSSNAVPGPLAGESFSPDRVPGASQSTEDLFRPATPSPGLSTLLLMALLAGIGALLTPCVFPMIPITVGYFATLQNLSARHHFLLAATYAGTIIALYTIPGILLSMFRGAGALPQIATHPLSNLFIIVLIFLFGLNLLGLLHLRMPSSLIQRSARAEKSFTTDTQNLRQQIPGVFFMAMTFTLVSFSCTVGFVGGMILPMAATGQSLYPFLGMLVFSSVFSLPFFGLALFPSAALRMGRRMGILTGDWMNDVKILFGTIVLAISFRFVSNLDLYWQWGIFTRDVVLAIWTLLFLAAALMVLKIFHPRRETNPSPFFAIVIRALIALCLIGLAARTGTGIGNDLPMGAWMDGWLPPVPYPKAPKPDDVTDPSQLTWIIDDIDSARNLATIENRPLLIQFTGFQCSHCRLMDRTILLRPNVQTHLAEMICVKAFTDGALDRHRTQREYQINRFDTVVLPFYAILNPNTDEVLSIYSGHTTKETDFIGFLEKGIRQFRSANNPR